MPISGAGGNDFDTMCLLHFNESDGVTTTYDSALGASTPDRSFTISGTGSGVDSAQKKFGGGSLYLPGTDTYLTMPYDDDWYLGDQEFSIDFWIRFEDYTVAGGIFCQEYSTNSDYVFCYWNGSSGVIQFRVYGAGFTRVDMTYDITTIANDTWYHIAIVRGYGGVTNNYALFVDGVQVDTDSSSYTVPSMPAPFEIGRETVGTTEYIEGWIDEFRITKGKTLWTENFTPPSSQTRSWNVDHQLKLLLHADEDDADVNTFDSSDTESGKTVTSNGVACDESQKKFGKTSGRFNGSSDYLSLADSGDWSMSTGNVTIDFWVRFNVMADVNGTYYGLFQQYENDSNYSALYHVQLAGTKYLYFKLRIGGSDLVTFSGSWSPVVDTWYHIALIRGWSGNANDWAITVDGSTVATVTDTQTWSDFTGAFEIGRIQSHPATAYLNGWIDEFRVLKGQAFWTAAFTPPTAPSRETKYSKLIIHFDGEHDNSTQIDSVGHNIYRAGSALVDDAQYKFAPCSLRLPGSSDGYYANDSDQFHFGDRPFTIDFWVLFNGTNYEDSQNPFIGQRTDATNWWGFYYSHATPAPVGQMHLALYVEVAGSGVITGLEDWTYTPSGWNHLALIRGWEGNPDKYAICVNGVALTTFVDSTSFPNFTGTLRVGDVYLGSVLGWQNVDGWMDEVRVVVGDARWVGTFTPPTRKYGDQVFDASFTVNSVDDPSSVIAVPSADIVTVSGVGPR